MRSLLSLLRPTARQLARRPLTAFIVIATLAIAIGANTALFSVLRGVVLRPLPYPEADRLVVLARPGSADAEADVSIPDAVDLRARVESLDTMALYLPSWAFDLVGDGPPERLRGIVAEPQLFEVLGLRPLLGRTYTASDDVPGGERVALIGEGLWTRRFGGDEDVLGRTLRLSGHEVTILGVLPRRADVFGVGAEIWVPPAVETPWALEERGSNNFEVLARLAPEADLETASTELRGVTESLAEAHPRTNRAKILEARSLHDVLVGDVRPALAVLMAAVGAVLLLACANVAGLLLVRAMFRDREISIRRALGAGRRRITGQFLLEGAMLAVPGALLGILLAVWLKDLLVARAPVEVARVDAIGLDPQVLAFAVGITLVVTIFTGLVPAWRTLSARRPDLLRSGPGTEGGTSRQRLLAGLVVVEIALSTVLLVGSALLVRTFLELRAVDLGFDVGSVLTADVVLPEARYGENEAQSRFFERVVDELSGAPGVESAASVIGLPLEPDFAIGHSVVFEHLPDQPPEEQGAARSRPVVGDFFGALGLPVLEGRGLLPTDREDAPRVAVVNRAFARAVWEGESPLGKRFSWRLGEEPAEWMTVVGVVGDGVGPTPQRAEAPTVYTPYLQRRVDWQRFGQLVLRYRGSREEASAVLRAAVDRVDPTIPLDGVMTMESRLEAGTARERFGASVLAAFAAVAVVLAAQGLYGLLAFAVGRRRRELGIRKALGAREADLLRLVLGRGALLAALGVAVGWLGALAGARLLESLLFGLAPWDVASYGIAGAVLGVTALAAAWLPARRAASADPRVALQDV